MKPNNRLRCCTASSNKPPQDEGYLKRQLNRHQNAIAKFQFADSFSKVHVQHSYLYTNCINLCTADAVINWSYGSFDYMYNNKCLFKGKLYAIVGQKIKILVHSWYCVNPWNSSITPCAERRGHPVQIRRDHFHVTVAGWHCSGTCHGVSDSLTKSADKEEDR